MEWSFLHLAVWKGDFALVSGLLRAGADPMSADSQGDIPLDLARELQDIRLISLLVTAAETHNSTMQPNKQTNSTLDSSLRPLQYPLDSFASSKRDHTATARTMNKVHPA